MRPGGAKSRFRGRAAVLFVLGTVATASASAEAQTVSLDDRAFGSALRIEAVVTPERSRETTRALLRAALDRVRHIEALTRADGDAAGGVGALLAAAGSEVALDPRLFLLLARALDFCEWSQNAHGPLGGLLYGLWGLEGRARARPPTPDVLEGARQAADCRHLRLDAERGTATLAPGSDLLLWGFARGWAVDQAVATLEEAGLGSGWVQIGHVARTFGAGPGGEGWPFAISPLPGDDSQDQRIVLRDRAVAMASAQERAFRVAGQRFAPYLDQRSGRPIADRIAVLVAAPRATDAEALASALFVMPNREGEFRLGTLDPAPAVRWVLGTGEGRPLINDRGWSALERWQEQSGSPFANRRQDDEGRQR